ncbi:PTS sugar transporter subunit IIA [Verrucomicrobiaceae bacterium N1E253]|uniref:PTS sugar transporter subunit IIA n=1 Tax=Oceaniferula marina TaxID=2748318 RepID=A0A851GFX2_9BACT|nr:PTS sugar transporter subunit IIA [Oceaniferula marina]NWK56678.1 PTS sugar transporter subunit IIA [Oceaniferula marina]
MKLASLLTPDQVILDLEAEVCVEAINGILDHLIAKDLLAADMRQEVFDALYEREQQISTGIGYGVAIPHAFSESIDRVIACFARSKEGVEFESIDHAPVNFIVLFIVPQKDYNMHLQTLAAIAKMFNNCEVRQRLGEAPSIEEVLDIFASRPSRTHCEQ